MKAEIIDEKLVISPTTATELYAMKHFLDWNKYSLNDLIIIDAEEYLNAED